MILTTRQALHKLSQMESVVKPSRVEILKPAFGLEIEMAAIVPAQFRDDPVASVIAWTPLVKGGVTFRTRLLTQSEPGRCEFVATRGMMLAPFFMAGMAFFEAVLCVVVFKFLAGDAGMGELIEKGQYVPLIVLGSAPLGALFFLGVAAFFWHMTRRPIVFDRSSGYFWKGSKNPAEQTDPDRVVGCARLEQIAGLQILSEYVESRDSDGHTSQFHSYELNLVLRDAVRLIVVDHGNRAALRKDAAMLAEFLDVPVWDATLPTGR